MALSDEDVREILRIIDESELDELQIQTPEFKLHVRRSGAPGEEPAGDSLPPPAAPAPAAEEQAKTSDTAAADGALTVQAPMLGTFYRAESPSAEPFVEPGARVEKDTVVCVIEVMKMMNSIPAGVAGTVVDVCAENAKLVEYGQPLFRVDPDG